MGSTGQAKQAACPVTWHFGTVVVIMYANAFWFMGVVVNHYSCDKLPVRRQIVQQSEQSVEDAEPVQVPVQKPEESVHVVRAHGSLQPGCQPTLNCVDRECLHGFARGCARSPNSANAFGRCMWLFFGSTRITPTSPR